MYEYRRMNLLTVPEVADRLRVSKETVRRWCRSGKLRAFPAGRAYRIHEDAVQEIESTGVSA